MNHAYLGTRYQRLPRRLTKLKARQLALGRFKYDGRFRPDIKIPESRIQYFLFGFVALEFLACYVLFLVFVLKASTNPVEEVPKVARSRDSDDVALVVIAVSSWLSVIVTALSGICFSDK